MKTITKVFKYIFLGLSIITTSFIIYESCLDSETSSKQVSFLTNIVKNIFNDGFNLKDEKKNIKPTSLELKPSSFAYNNIDGYLPSELPIGCTKQLESILLPSNASNKSIKYEAYPDNIVNIVPNGNIVSIEAVNYGSVNIKATSLEDASINYIYTFNIVDLKAPSNFDIPNSDISIPLGLSKYIDITMLEEHLNNNALLMPRYYNKNLLSYSFSNENIATHVNNYIVAKNIGSTKLTISNGTISKSININVVNNPNPIVKPTSLEIEGSNSVYVLDVDYDRYEVGKHNTPLSIKFNSNDVSDSNVIWSVDKPLVALIDDNGVVRGYRKTSEEDVPFTVTATSVMDPSIKATYNMISKHVLPTSLDINTSSLSLDEDGYYKVEKNKNISIKVDFSPSNVSKTDLIVSSSNDNIASIYFNGSSLVISGKQEGKVDITVTSKYVTSLTISIKIKCYIAPYVNEGNINTFTYNIRKFFGGHAFLFMINTLFIGLYLFLSHKDKKTPINIVVPLLSLVIGILLGITSEVIQIFAPGRSFALLDILIDSNGALIATVIIGVVLLIYLLFSKKKKIIKNN